MGLIRRITLVRRREDVSPEEFRRHWLEVHAPLARGLEGLRGYRINLVVDGPEDLGWDGIGELWFDSVEAATAAFAVEPLAQRIEDDVATFVAERRAFFVEEHLVLPGVVRSGEPGAG